MTDDLATARRYLAPPSQSFWEWRDQGEVIVWANETTILFRGELVHVLRHLAPQGLPPLNAVVLLLAACRDSWRESSSEIGTLAGLMVSIGRRSFPYWFSEVLRQLDAVAGLHDDLRKTPQSKAILAEMVLETCRDRTTPEDAAAILRVLEAGPTQEVLEPQKESFWEDLVHALGYIREGLKRFDAEALELRLRTGLDQLVEPAEIEFPPAERAKRLIAALQDDEELGGVARIARQLLAAVHLPRSVSDWEDLPVGGVSDITNRGPLDRLLLSELAQDDLTLAVRVALREALYLRREAPPRHPPRHRAVLLDAGLRTWGVPRVFITAVGLALAATGSRQIEVDVFRAEGRDVAPVDLISREGLIRHLQALEPEAHPGEALPAFLSAVEEKGDLSEVVLVTGEDVAADADFQRALAAQNIPAFHLATVDRDGRFRLVSRALHGAKVVCQAKLALEDLLEFRSRPSVPLVDKSRTPDLPAILHVEPFPLLLPHEIDWQRIWPVEGGGALAVTRDGRLMHWSRPDRGARQWTDKLPSTGTVWWHAPRLRETTALAVVGNQQTGLYLYSADLETGAFQSVRLELEHGVLEGFCEFGGTLFAVYETRARAGHRSRVEAIDMTTGSSMARCASHGTKRFGRIFRLHDGWYAVSYDGLAIRWERVPESGAEAGIEAVFERAGHEGYFKILRTGLYSSAEGSCQRLMRDTEGPFLVEAIAEDGAMAMLSRPDDMNRLWRIDLTTLHAQTVWRDRTTGPAVMLRRAAVEKLVRRQSLPWRFAGVAYDGNSLVLISRKRHHWRLTLDRSQDRLRLEPRRAPVLAHQRFFQHVASPPGCHFQLRLAEWENGSRAWTDSRGMLHLRSSDPAIPDVTLVLSESGVAGWVADGRVWGNPCFIGNQAGASAARIHDEILKPLLERWPW